VGVSEGAGVGVASEEYSKGRMIKDASYYGDTLFERVTCNTMAHSVTST